MDSIEAASAFLGMGGRSGMHDSTMPSETHTITGTATSDSADGTVRVDLEGYTVSADGEQSLELPTTVDVKEGDTVQVTLVGGTGKSPIVTGVVGGGDRLSNNVQDAVDAAEAATEAVSSVTNYFFHDTDGAHVTTTPDDATTGKNVLIDADGLNVRDGAASVAYFHAGAAQVGEDESANVNMSSSGITMTVPWRIYDYRTGQWIDNGVKQAMSISYSDEDGSAVVESPESGLTLQSSGRLKIWSNSDMMVRADFGKPINLIADNVVILNNANTQLWSGTTQDLADALKPPIKIQKFAKTVQIGANAFVSTDLGTINVPTGYSFLGIVANENGYGDQWLVSYSWYGGKCQAMIHSKYGATLTSTLIARAIFIRSDLMS